MGFFTIDCLLVGKKKTLPVGGSRIAWTGLLTSREEHFVVLSWSQLSTAEVCCCLPVELMSQKGGCFLDSHGDFQSITVFLPVKRLPSFLIAPLPSVVVVLAELDITSCGKYVVRFGLVLQNQLCS